MSKSLIINPPFLEPHRPPISCAIIAEVLRLCTHQVAIVDLNIELFHAVGRDRFYDLQVKTTTNGINADDIDRLIEYYLPETLVSQQDWIFVSVFSYWNQATTKKIFQHLRKSTRAKLVVGGSGIEVDNFGADLYQQDLIDFFIYGEGEHAVAALVTACQEKIAGVNGQAVQQIDDIETLPLPNYGFFDLAKYDWLLDAPDVFIYGSRGCVRKCSFCDVEHYWPKFRWRSGQSIADEMIKNYELYGIKNFFFADSLVNGNQKEFRIMCEKLANYSEGLFRWGSYAIVRPRRDHPSSLFDMIAAAGGRFWSLGIETGVDRIRFEMQKKFTNDDVDWHLEQSQRVGLQNNFLLLPTWPSESLQEHQEYLDIFRRWQCYAVDGTIFGMRVSATLNIMPKSPLGRELGKTIFLENLAAHDVGAELAVSAWQKPSNNSLSYRERLRRSLAIYREAMKYQWPITNSVQNLNELRAMALAYKGFFPKRNQTFDIKPVGEYNQ